MIPLQISLSKFVGTCRWVIYKLSYCSAATSDMIAFASQMTYQEFLNQSHQLSKLESYPQLTSRSERIGFKVSKVVYRGYQASSALQVGSKGLWIHPWMVCLLVSSKVEFYTFSSTQLLKF